MTERGAPPHALPCVIVLASGRGERFTASGARVHKLDAMLAGRSVLERTLAAVRASGLAWHIERGAHAGMGDTIAAAVRATRDEAGWLVLPADLPLVRPTTIRRVADVLSWGAADVVLPLSGGQRGHPVGFSPRLRTALAALRGDAGASSVVETARRAMRFTELELDDPGATADIDTLEDLARAEEMLGRLGGDQAIPSR